MTATLYDFRAPPKGRAGRLAEDWLTLACRAASRRWREMSAFPDEVGVGLIESRPPGEVIGKLPETTPGFRLMSGGVHSGPLFLIIPRPLLLGLIAAYLGEPLESLPEDRPVTAVEGSLYDLLLRELILEPLAEGWPGREQPTFEFAEAGPVRMSCPLPAKERCLVVTLRLGS